jgi:predicted nucleic acid-binding protein
MIGVVDTSALIRLFVPDGPLPNDFEGFLRGVERGLNVAIAPEFLLAEAANVLNKKQLSGELSESESNQLLSDILTVPIRFFPHRPILVRAFELAKTHHLTVYDTLYLALAEEHGAVIFTCDRKLLTIAARLQLQ